MATEVNIKFKEEGGQIVSNELFTVTIALEEYRSLVQQVERLDLLLDRANEEIRLLIEEKNRLLNGSDYNAR